MNDGGLLKLGDEYIGYGTWTNDQVRGTVGQLKRGWLNSTAEIHDLGGNAFYLPWIPVSALAADVSATDKVIRLRQRLAGDPARYRKGYVLLDSPGTPDVVLVATGSEVQLAVEACRLLADKGVAASVVSMPCVEWFDEQDEAYRASVLPRSVTARVVVEAGARQCWDRFLGEHGVFVGMTGFGASAPYDKLYKHFGITPEHVAAEVKGAIGKK